MKTLTLFPSHLSGSVDVQPSKYLAHRFIIAASLALGTSELSPVAKNDDVFATLEAVQSLGLSDYTWEGEKLIVDGGKQPHNGRSIDCNESGSTLRFLLPLPVVFGAEAVFQGRGRLLDRPMKPYEDIFSEQGLRYVHNGTGIHIAGTLHSGTFEIPGNISSQFITGLLFALPLLNGDSSICLTSPLESKGYVEMTLSVVRRLGISALWKSADTLFIPGGQHYVPVKIRVDGDWAHAAFFITAGALGQSEVTLKGLNPSLQQDSQIVDVLKEMGADIVWQGDVLRVRGSRLKALNIDGRNIPDLVPILSVAACAAEGETVIRNLERLRYKESNRLEGMVEQLVALGGEARVEGDALIVRKSHLRGGKVSSLGDHRIAMSLAVAATLCEGPMVLSEAGSVTKSAPQFWEEYTALGGVFHG